MVRLDLPDGTWVRLSPVSGAEFLVLTDVVDADKDPDVELSWIKYRRQFVSMILEHTIEWSGEGPITSQPLEWLMDLLPRWVNATEEAAVPPVIAPS